MLVAPWTVVGACALLVVAVWMVMRARVARARAGERHAVERRDRFFATAASELDAPLVTIRDEVAALDPWSATPERVATITRQLDQLRTVVAELARLPAPIAEAERRDVELAELVREIVAEPPFSDRGPGVIVRAAPVIVRADRARLATGLRLLLWVVRREVGDGDSLVVTLSSDAESAWLELDSGGRGGMAAEALEMLPAVGYGLRAPEGEPGTTLALQVATQVARVHGGRLSASARVGKGERFVLELPRTAAAAAMVH
jgi:signal transduction histidine kinase